MTVRSVELQPGLIAASFSLYADTGFRMTAHSDRPRIHFSRMLKGAVDVTSGRGGFRLTGDTSLTSFAPGARFPLRFSGPCRSVELIVAPETLSVLSEREYNRISTDLGRGYLVHLGCHRRSTNGAAVRLAGLLDREEVPPLLVHAAALEFLARHLDVDGAGRSDVTIPARERTRLLAARERLLLDLSTPPTLKDLARESGLNELKLKRGFRALFGTSVYALFQRERMDRARALLHDHNVTETAVMLGYSNISHFGAAFRKRFGVSPGEARRGALD